MLYPKKFDVRIRFRDYVGILIRAPKLAFLCFVILWAVMSRLRHLFHSLFDSKIVTLIADVLYLLPLTKQTRRIQNHGNSSIIVQFHVVENELPTTYAYYPRPHERFRKENVEGKINHDTSTNHTYIEKIDNLLVRNRTSKILRM